MQVFKEKLTGHRRMRFIFIAVTCLVLFVAPVSAQSAQSASGAGEITPAGLLAAVVIIVGAFFTSGGVFVTWVNHRFAVRDAVRKQVDLNAEARREEDSIDARNRDKLTEGVLILAQGLRDANAAQAKRDSAQDTERKELREMLETKKQAEDGRDSVVGKINSHLDDSQTSMRTHLDGKSKTTDAGVQRLEAKVDELKKEVEQLATKDDLKDQLMPFQRQIDEFAQLLLIIKKQTTGNLNPQIALDAERARGIANGDTTA